MFVIIFVVMCKIDVRMKLTVLISRQGVALLTVLADIETVTTET